MLDDDEDIDTLQIELDDDEVEVIEEVMRLIIDDDEVECDENDTNE